MEDGESGDGFTLAEGTLAVKAARAVVDAAVNGDKEPPRLDFPRHFARPGAAFTTLSTFPHGELRGCVGFAEPVLPLAQAIQASAVAAALEDSRFPPVEPLELELIVVEVSLLTRPREVKRRPAEDLPCAIHVGRHGLVVREGKRRGLLLPQVPVDCGWDATEFLSQTCVKAGLSPDAWKSPGPAVFTFEARVFVEERPRGAVVRHVANGAAAAQRKRGAKESL